MNIATLWKYTLIFSPALFSQKKHETWPTYIAGHVCTLLPLKNSEDNVYDI